MLLASIDIEPVVQKLVLESNLENVGVVDELIARIRNEYDISEELCNDIWLALNEAVSNAIRHGNKFDPAKKVRISLESKYDRFICLSVKDEGSGFDPESVPDPTSSGRIGEPGGRGVFLISRIADKVEYSLNGTCLEMCFDLYKN
ncbi:MAG: ATP-binding protein [Bacteroidia bacterium]